MTIYKTVKQLVELGPQNIPQDMLSNENLIYSSPATLSYNSPGAQGFGVKRAGLVIPESVMLVVSPACCGRNTTVLADEGGYSDRIFFLQMDETDLVTGRHLTEIPEAINQILEVCEKKPKVVVICITCVDALLGTDLERVCRKAEAECGVKVVPSYMYALTREGKNPPMVAIRETIYSLIERPEVKPEMVNFIGNFTHLEDDCELYDLFAQIGLTDIREVGRIKSYDEYLEMGQANFNLILNPEARKAAFALDKRLGMPYAELTRLYEIDRIKKQYQMFGAALGVKFDDQKYYDEAALAVEKLAARAEGLSFAIGQVVNGNAVEMALALCKMGINVKAIFANVSPEDYPYLREIERINPDMRIYQALSPKMLGFDGEEHVDVSIGIDCEFYYPESINVKWNDEEQPFGYTGLKHFAERVIQTLDGDVVIDVPKETEEVSYNCGVCTSDVKLRGLRKYLSPFTPDQSGAVSVLYHYGGMLIIMDAGGCVGNICGYDEPRWTGTKSAIFSAGLRDLDAILGRDELLIRKTRDALKSCDSRFVGLIGTPVPAVIATDYRALKRLMEKDYGVPVVPIETDGMELYDKGQEKAYLHLMKTFAKMPGEISEPDGRIGILGATPLDTTAVDAECDFRAALGIPSDCKVVCYGISDSLEDVALAAMAAKNIVVSPSGIKAAKWLEDKFGTPYEVMYPVSRESRQLLADKFTGKNAKRILVVHQQLFANEIRNIIEESMPGAEVDVATWFMLKEAYARENDAKLVEESELLSLVNARGYDMVIADPLMKRALPGYDGVFLDLPHYTVSGALHSSETTEEYYRKAGDERC